MSTDAPTERTRRQVGVPDGNVVLDLFVLHQRIGELMEAALVGTGVRPAEFAVYSQLGIDAMTPRELSARLGVTPSTLTGHLSTLHRRGHTERLAAPGDRRSYRVQLTEDGHAALEAGRRGFRVAVQALDAELERSGLGRPEAVRAVLAGLDAAADRVTARLQEAAAGTGPDAAPDATGPRSAR